MNGKLTWPQPIRLHQAFNEPRKRHGKTARLGRHRKRGSAPGAANTFRAEIADGRCVEEMVFRRELIWDDDPPPEAAGELEHRRR